MIHMRKKSSFKANIQIIKGMSFKDLISFAFPGNPPNGKRFIAKSSLESNAIEFLPDQIMETIFFNQHADIWIDLEKIDYDYLDLFGED